MVRMSDVWDRAADVIAGRRGILVSIAFLFMWLPGVIQAAAALALGGSPADGAAMSALAFGTGSIVLVAVAVIVLALAVVGQLALVAVASDPAATRRDALGIAVNRFWVYVGAMAVVAVAAALLLVPLGIALASGYPSLAAIRTGVPPQFGAGTALFVVLYCLALAVALVWVEARFLWLLVPVIVNERLGLRSFARAFQLSRGLTWRIIGVMLLFGIVAIVAVLATRGVAGVALRLLLGTSGASLAAFLTTAVVSLVSCAVQVVIATFVAQLYVACRGPAVADIFR